MLYVPVTFYLFLKYAGEVSLLLKQQIRIYETIVIFNSRSGKKNGFYHETAWLMFHGLTMLSIEFGFSI